MIKFLLFTFIITGTTFAQSTDDFKNELKKFKSEKEKFIQYKNNIKDDFKNYKKEQAKTLEDYKKEISIYWDNPELSTKTVWNSYSEDKKTRSSVDFDNEIITIETLAKSSKEASKKLKIELSRVITINNKTVQETDPLEQRLSKLKKPSSLIVSKVSSEPILTNIVFDTPPNKEKIVEYVNNKVNNNITYSKSNKLKDYIVYSVSVKLPKNSMIKKSKIYYDEVKKQSRRQNIPIPLIFAIIHSESSYNPRARSHVPAYGLMQIVPETAGIDAYKYLYNKRRVVSGSYLYNSKNNITMGSAYLHILYYKYLKNIKNRDSRLYCTIAAYNTGAGNVARAFTRTNDILKASQIINSLSPSQVYEKLLTNLKYKETKRYLQKVTKRVSAYHKMYGT